jgi:hypothetical protein
MSTVASRPKILQNNSKSALEKKTVGREKLAAVGQPFFAKSGRKKIFYENHVFFLANHSFCDKFSLQVSSK